MPAIAALTPVVIVWEVAVQGDVEPGWRMAQRAVEAAGGVVTADTYRDGVDFRYDLRVPAVVHAVLPLRGVLRLPANSDPVLSIAFDAGSALRGCAMKLALPGAALLVAGPLMLLGSSWAPALAAGGAVVSLASCLTVRCAMRIVRRRVLSAAGFPFGTGEPPEA